MTTLKIEIKKSKNVHAWSNNHIGTILIATIAKDTKRKYEVDFALNKLPYDCSDGWVSGYVNFEDAKVQS